MLLSSFTTNLTRQNKKARMLFPHLPFIIIFLGGCPFQSLSSQNWEPRLSPTTSTPTPSPPPGSQLLGRGALPSSFFALHPKAHLKSQPRTSRDLLPVSLCSRPPGRMLPTQQSSRGPEERTARTSRWRQSVSFRIGLGLPG